MFEVEEKTKQKIHEVEVYYCFSFFIFYKLYIESKKTKVKDTVTQMLHPKVLGLMFNCCIQFIAEEKGLQIGQNTCIGLNQKQQK